MYELAFTSQQKEAKEFRKYCCNTLFPQLRQHFEQLAISEQQQRIEQNESTIAILNDDLDESQREYAILEYKYEQLEYRAVPYLEDPKKDKGIVVIQNNNGDEYPYIAICGQQGYVAQKIKNKLIDFPNGQIVVLAEPGNAIVHYNFIREREHQQVIEEKDDEIQNLIQNRHVPHIGEHDNILCAIDKNTAEEHHPYYMIRCQRMRLQKRINILRAKYPDMIIKRPEYDAANAVICWVGFKQYIGRENYHRNHFSLDEDSRDVFEDTFDIQM